MRQAAGDTAAVPDQDKGLMKLFLLFISALILGLGASQSHALELESTLVHLTYENESQLRKFSRKMEPGGLFYLFGGDSTQSLDKDVAAKLDLIVRKVQKILDMYPENFKCEVVLLETTGQVQQAYQELYGTKVGFVAFYSPGKHRIYLALNKLELAVFAHEMAHAVIHKYFRNAPPVKIHEVLAQYVTNQMENSN